MLNWLALHLPSLAETRQTRWPLLVFGLALGLNLLTVWYEHFDGLYGQDAYSYFAHSQELFAHFSLFHHWQWEVAPRLLYWPMGYPALVTVFFVFSGATPGAAQLVSLLVGAAAAGLLTSLGYQLSGSWTVGLVAGSGLALSGLMRQVEVSVMSDAPALFWTTLAVWLTWHARSSGRGRWLLTAGLAFGLAGITRYTAFSAWPLLGLAWFWPAKGRERLRVLWLVGAVGLTGLVYLPQFVINQLYPSNFWTNSWLADWSPANVFQTHFETRDGIATYPSAPLVFYLGFGLLNPRLLTPLALPLVGLGLVRLVKIKKELFLLVLLLCWWLLAVLLFSGIPYENERFSLTFLPPVALLAGLGADWLVRWLKSNWLTDRKKARLGLIGGFGLVGVGMALFSQQHVAGFIAVKENDLAIVRQIEAQLPSSATLITFDLSLTFDHYTSLKVIDLSFLEIASLPELSKKGPLYLLAAENRISQERAGEPIGRAFEAARQRAIGSALAQFGPYKLWKLGP